MIDRLRTVRLDGAWLRRRALPAAVLTCWLVWAALAWWSAPRAADQSDLARDLAAGRVLTITRVDGWETGGPWGRRPEPRYAPGGSTVVWTRPDGQFRYTYLPARTPTEGDITGVGPGPEASPEPDAATWPGPDPFADPLADPRARDAVTHGGDTLADAVANAAATLALVIGVGWLLMLVAGPPPVVGTRWYWFWVGLLPLGLGVLAWTWRERWRADVPATRPRRSGWSGLGWFILGGIAISLVLAVAGTVLGRYVVPGG
ncbi:hypothetical protein O7602_13440 [Micromonospora sp. WMMD1128]|uniref:hypothetical protein n=1 Tax=Micromonospora sp. WMMD1128 TaxID=3015150 RepID=UPI00248CFB78|nr:hypothetical protein [Micromonospora sp. WMMD1128]WBB76469.1 hypothetical protein O7602_13440 [Micromonospora sp. WMMD1128]